VTEQKETKRNGKKAFRKFITNSNWEGRG